MKKILSILMLLLCLVLRADAQDFEPGQQAQGLLESKNVTVDYATGLFHYQVPLYVLRSGDYELPVTLDYVGKGVKVDDVSGGMGYNWSLNTGGIVTRTIRGGIADESGKGYLRFNPETLKTDSLEVHGRNRDGECDLFTAVFNGRSVEFIVRLDNGRLYGEPLERGNVRIEGTMDRYTIESWTVTDESGNRYIYKEKAWSADINREDANSLNGVHHESYISSWYLSCIEPLNSAPIVYTYLKPVKSEGEQKDIRVTRYTETYKTQYHYGNPIRDRSFDYLKHKEEFYYHIGRAKSHMPWTDLDVNWDYIDNLYDQAVETSRIPDFTDGEKMDQYVKRVMGGTADLRNLSSISVELTCYIASLVGECYDKLHAGGNTGGILEPLNAALGCLLHVLEENPLVNETEVVNVTTYEIRSPLLKRIQCGDQYVEFSNREKKMVLRDLMGKRISGRSLRFRGNELAGVLYLDKDDNEVSRVEFDYYRLPENPREGQDIWGFPCPGGTGYAPVESDLEYSKSNSLKSITLPHKGKIEIDYGLNKVSHAGVQEQWGMPFGGVRTERLVLTDYQTGTVDTIRYGYPHPGTAVMCFLGEESVQYSGFTDMMRYSRMKPIGFAFTNTGNGGFYYPEVVETVEGKGRNVYTFHVTDAYVIGCEPECYWLNGLPIGVSRYDADGNLVSRTKNVYYTDGCPSSPNGDCFVQGGESSRYSRSLPQVKAYDYYIDREKMKAHYETQKKVLLYSLGAGREYYVNLYEESYIPNIEPRTSAHMIPGSYDLRYGGATLLKERTEYRYDGNPVSADGVSFVKTEYFYDNEEESVRPTRIVRTDSRNHTLTKVMKRVTEMEEETDSVIARMRERNVLSPVIKEITLRDGWLRNETISRYRWSDTDGTGCLELRGQYTYASGSPLPYVESVTDSLLFTYGEADYTRESAYGYKRVNGNLLPVEECVKGVRTVHVYEPVGCQAILSAEGTGFSSVLAVDLMKHDKAIMEEVEAYEPYYALFRKFYGLYKRVELENLPADCMVFMRSPEHAMMMEIIRPFAGQDTHIDQDRMTALLDSVRTDAPNRIGKFFSMYNSLFETYPGYEMPYEELNRLFLCVIDPSVITPRFMECLDYLTYYREVSAVLPLTLSLTEGSFRMNLHVLHEGAGKVSCTICHAGGTTPLELDFPATGHYTVDTAEIDLGAYSGEVTVNIDRMEHVAYAAIVPEGVPFEATSYHADRSVFARFDQTGALEVNEYDSAGRLVRVNDENGGVINEKTYYITKD